MWSWSRWSSLHHHSPLAHVQPKVAPCWAKPCRAWKTPQGLEASQNTGQVMLGAQHCSTIACVHLGILGAMGPMIVAHCIPMDRLYIALVVRCYEWLKGWFDSIARLVRPFDAQKSCRHSRGCRCPPAELDCQRLEVGTQGLLLRGCLSLIKMERWLSQQFHKRESSEVIVQ